ncbi:MAG: LysE family translocator [Sterolibacteriaceae bacterium MAG5]|nr:LysE family translocator [Candidatus Nitricoxidireducens bremensis]
MHDSGTFGLFLAASLALALTPGPNWLYLVSRTVAQGRAAGLASWCGTTAGLVVHVLLAASGLSALLALVPAAYHAIRLIGAAYLLWMAWDLMRAPADAPQGAAKPLPVRVMLRQAWLTSVLNPKVAVFYAAFLPQFIDAGGNVLAQTLTLGAINVAMVATADIVLILVAARVASALGVGRRVLLGRRALGAVFAALAGWLAFDRRGA